MANSKHDNAGTPLMSDNDHDRSSHCDLSDYVVYESSDLESVTLSGSTINESLSEAHSIKNGYKDEESLPDTETLPVYKPEASEYETATLLSKSDHHDRYASDGESGRRGRSCRETRCPFFNRCRRVSAKSDRKSRVRRRIVMFVKAVMLFCLFSFFVTKMCLRHSKSFRGFSEDIFEDASTSRKIIIHNGAEAFSGVYPLYDVLAIRTTSGSINLVVDPQPAHPDYPDEPARLFIEARSGSVSVDFLQHTQSPLPYRRYEIHVYSSTGSISGNFLFTSDAQLYSHSGAISATLIPVISPDDDINEVSLLTKTYSAPQSIIVTEPLIVGSSLKPASHFNRDTSIKSSHIGKSGDVVVEYPQSWAGQVTARSPTDSVILGGEGLRVTVHNKKYLKAIKQPSNDKQHEWWGSSGDMDVSLNAKGSSTLIFRVKDDVEL